MLGNYKKNCEFIRNRFGLAQSSSIYDIVNAITESFMSLEDKLKMAEAKQPEETQCLQKKGKRKS